MSSAKKLMGTTAVGGALAIEDVFSTYLYTGTGSAQTITNGIDLAGEGGLVWIKERSPFARNHHVVDTERGIGGTVRALRTNLTDAEWVLANPDYEVTSANSDGFSLGINGTNETNRSGDNYASWTFRKAPRFFDVVTYTGDGTTTKTVSHNLGVMPGHIIVKRTDSTDNWTSVARYSDTNYFGGYAALGSTYYFGLNTTGIVGAGVSPSDRQITDASFNPGRLSGPAAAFEPNEANTSGATYVAYLFAHDPLGPSGDGSDGLIACGSATIDGSGNATVDLGWEPQWILTKRSDSTGDWAIADNMRGMPVGTAESYLVPNTSAAEATYDYIDPTATGFNLKGLGSGSTYIYIAIRRGPMRQPTSGTEVFAMDTYDTTTGDPTAYDTTFPIDAAWQALNKSTTTAHRWSARITGGEYMTTSSTAAGTTLSAYEFDNQTGFRTDPGTDVNDFAWMFRRAPGFFDTTCYIGDGVAGRTVPHNLGVAPELVIIKQRSGTQKWPVGSTAFPSGGNMVLNETGGIEGAGGTARFYYAGWDASNFGIGQDLDVNGSGSTYIAYLFATLPGVSKVGSYTGNGTNQTIDCGFTSGARFVLIKRTDSTGDWYIWDTERGIVAANDPHLSLNTTAAEVTTDDSVDPDNSGFIVNQVAATNINVSSASYIYYAVS